MSKLQKAVAPGLTFFLFYFIKIVNFFRAKKDFFDKNSKEIQVGFN